MPQSKLTKRTDGRFKCKFKDKQFYGKTQAEALKKRDYYAQEEGYGLDPEMEDVSFLEYGLRWVEIYRCNSSNPQKKQYSNMVSFAAKALPRKKLKSITSTDLQALCNMLTSYSASHVNKFMTILRGIFRSAVADGAILRNPMDNVKRPKNKKSGGHRALEQWERSLVVATCQEHDFGLCAMVMLFAGLRRGEALYLNVDRDVDFEHKTLTVRGSVSFINGNQGVVTEGKTKAALRTIPLVRPLENALRDHHGLLCTKMDGEMMTETSFRRKYDSYMTFLATKLNGCPKYWYGRTNEHKRKLMLGEKLPAWRDVNIRCHDFRVDFCTRAYEAGIPVKTLQAWMGHADTTMIMNVYAKLTKEQEQADALKLAGFMNQSIRVGYPTAERLEAAEKTKFLPESEPRFEPRLNPIFS